MKKLLVLFLVFSFVGVVYAGQSSVSPAGYAYPPATFQGTVTLTGNPGATKNVSVDNVVRTIAELITTAGGTFMANGVTPIGALISCDAAVTKWAFGGTSPSATIGHDLLNDAGVRLHLASPEYVATAKASNVSGDNTAVTCTITLEY